MILILLFHISGFHKKLTDNDRGWNIKEENNMGQEKKDKEIGHTGTI